MVLKMSGKSVLALKEALLVFGPAKGVPSRVEKLLIRGSELPRYFLLFLSLSELFHHLT
jgi:hypothetical protein